MSPLFNPTGFANSLSLFGAAFLLGPGVQRRYFEIDGDYEIPMEEDDPSFVLGGCHPGGEKPDLGFEATAPFASRQVELFRRGDDLYAQGLANEPVSWVGHKREWDRLKEGQSRRLCPGDRLILGVAPNVASVQDLPNMAEHAVLWIKFGNGKSSFRLSPLGPNQSPFLSYYASQDPVFKKSPERLYHMDGYRLPLEERFWLWGSWGLTRAERLLDLSARFRYELSDETKREFLGEAIRICERKSAKLLLAKACLYAGIHWGEKKNDRLAEQYLERGRSLLEAGRSSQESVWSLWTALGAALYQVHESALGRKRDRSRTAEMGRHYEGMAKYVVFLPTPDEDDSIGSIPLTRREFLERAATSYQTAGPEHRGDWERIQRQIQTEFGEGPFR